MSPTNKPWTGIMSPAEQRGAVPHDGLYDRSKTSHAVNLFDMSEKYADVSSTDALLGKLSPAQIRPRQ